MECLPDMLTHAFSLFVRNCFVGFGFTTEIWKTVTMPAAVHSIIAVTAHAIITATGHKTVFLDRLTGPTLFLRDHVSAAGYSTVAALWLQPLMLQRLVTAVPSLVPSHGSDCSPSTQTCSNWASSSSARSAVQFSCRIMQFSPRIWNQNSSHGIVEAFENQCLDVGVLGHRFACDERASLLWIEHRRHLEINESWPPIVECCDVPMSNLLYLDRRLTCSVLTNDAPALF